MRIKLHINNQAITIKINKYNKNKSQNNLTDIIK